MMGKAGEEERRIKHEPLSGGRCAGELWLGISSSSDSEASPDTTTPEGATGDISWNMHLFIQYIL